MSTTAQPDVNAAFAAERADQIQAAAARRADVDARVAAGTLIPLGNGQFRIDDPSSLDHGEILVARDGQILPQHGLDTSRGQVALYSSVPAWHELGNVVPGGTSDVEAVLQLGGIDFDVLRRPVQFRNSLDGPSLILPDHFVTVRADTGAGLGVVGGRYEVLQNRDAFGFLQDLVDRYDVVWESAGAVRDGRRVFICMRLPDTVTIDPDGVADQIIPFIVALNSHDGSSLFQVVVTPWRPECGNTERFALRDAHTRWGVRHTRNARDRIAEARRTLGLSVRYFQAFAAEKEALAQTEVTIAQFRQVVEELWPALQQDAPKRTQTHHRNRLDTLTGLYGSNSERLGATAYAAERAITEYADWKTPIRPTGSLRGRDLATAVLEGSNDDVKSQAHRQLLTLTPPLGHPVAPPTHPPRAAAPGRAPGAAVRDQTLSERSTIR
jgi:phage/plasmid-like protein (TIGR03299 family)